MLIGAHPRTTPILSSGHCIATSDGLGDSFDGLMLAKRVFISWISKKRISFFKKEKNPTNTAVKRNFFLKKKRIRHQLATAVGGGGSREKRVC